MDKTKQMSIVVFILFAALVTFIILYITKEEECGLSALKKDFGDVFDIAHPLIKDAGKNAGISDKIDNFLNCEKEAIIKNVGDNELRLATYTGNLCEIMDIFGKKDSLCNKYYDSKDFDTGCLKKKK